MEIEKICEDLRKCNNFNHCADCSFNNDIDVEIGDVQCMMNLSKCAAEVIEALQKQLAAVTAERDAAIEDMKIIADWYRECKCDDGICGLCKHDSDHGIEGYANECPGFERNDCFEWRGKGESNGV